MDAFKLVFGTSTLSHDVTGNVHVKKNSNVGISMVNLGVLITPGFFDYKFITHG